MARERALSDQHDNDISKRQRKGQEDWHSTTASVHRYSSDYTYEPLTNSKSQIRLLEMLPDGDRDCLRFRISIRHLENIANFNAVSYTWGSSTNLQRIFIDEKLCVVRENCYVALAQIYRVWKQGWLQSNLVWIDAVCINQSHEEKSLQVSIMGDIYGKATQVLTCVGPHADGSELLIEKAREVADFDFDCNHSAFLCDECRSPWEKWVRALDRETLERLCKACENFGRRDYWSRLWIVQETFKAASLAILCGHDMLPWRLLQNIEEFLGIEMTEIPSLSARSVEWNPMHDVFSTKRARIPINQIFERFSEFSCSDPRDRLYGLLSLIEWPEMMEPIVPDYRQSTFDLAVQVEPYIAFEDISVMLESFQINANDPAVQELVKKRHDEALSSAPNVPPEVDRAFKLLLENDKSSSGLCGVMGMNQNGDMTAPLIYESNKGRIIYNAHASAPSSPASGFSTDSEEYFRDEIIPDLTSNRSEGVPKKLMLGSEVAGFVCKEAVAGDILVPTTIDSLGSYLVLRQSHDELYDLIGQGVLQNRYKLRHSREWDGREAKQALFTAKVELKISAEDAILLVAQDFNHWHGQEGDYDQWDRPLTSVTGAARVTMQSPWSRRNSGDDPDAQRELDAFLASKIGPGKIARYDNGRVVSTLTSAPPPNIGAEQGPEEHSDESDD